LYTIFGGGGLRLFFNSLSEPLLVDTAGDNGGGGASLVGFNLTNGVSLFLLKSILFEVSGLMTLNEE